MTQCHQEMLIGFDIRSKLMVPIIMGDQFWGLMLASYRDIPHHWELEEKLSAKQKENIYCGRLPNAFVNP
jgi:hypothetical protein